MKQEIGRRIQIIEDEVIEAMNCMGKDKA